MDVKVIASTKVGYNLPKDEALDFSGKAAGVCYLPGKLEDLLAEPQEKTRRRVATNLRLGHHSVFGHATCTLCLEGIPKILAMLLNNEKVYNASEKSARYTQMTMSPRERELYDKWLQLFGWRIRELYPQLPEKTVHKLAQENARYLVSVFAPGTVLIYTTSLQQLNYMVDWAQKLLRHEPNAGYYFGFDGGKVTWSQSVGGTDFYGRLRTVLREFLEALPDLTVENLNSGPKNRTFSLFETRHVRLEEFGENYCTNYWGSLAQLAQAQRHRTLSYEMSIPRTPSFYVPRMIRETRLEDMWLDDISSLADLYPQGMEVCINERGTIENFALKCTERLCGAVQLEIQVQTADTLEKYLDALQESGDQELYQYLAAYAPGPRCTYPGWMCQAPCYWGPSQAMQRVV